MNCFLQELSYNGVCFKTRPSKLKVRLPTCEIGRWNNEIQPCLLVHKNGIFKGILLKVVRIETASVLKLDG